MLERALPLRSQQIAHDEDQTTDRSVRTGAFVRDLAERLARMLRAVGAFFAAGGALS
jgi:hypothetical protein